MMQDVVDSTRIQHNFYKSKKKVISIFLNDWNRIAIDAYF